MSVIKVRTPDTGFAQIPNKFAEDERLSTCATAVGLLLATFRDGTPIRPKDIQAIFSKRPGKPRGREWWARVASELKSAGYMWLNRTHAGNGQFVSDWIFCISGLSDLPTGGGTANVGSAGTGSSSTGLAVRGDGSKCLQQGVVQQVKTTTTTTASPKASFLQHRKATALQANSSRSGSDLVFEESIDGMSDQLLAVISSSSLDPELAQQLLDELAGVLEAGKRGERTPIGAPIGWFRQLVKKALAGEFDRNYCDRIASRRDKAARIVDQDKNQPVATEEQRHLASLARQEVKDMVNTWRRKQA
jgi:hypothetical protein